MSSQTFVRFQLNVNCELTQESVVGVRLEELFGTVEIETEWQENLHVGLLLKQRWVSWHGVLELINADSVVTLCIALGVQRIHYLSMCKKFSYLHEKFLIDRARKVKFMKFKFERREKREKKKRKKSV